MMMWLGEPGMWMAAVSMSVAMVLPLPAQSPELRVGTPMSELADRLERLMPAMSDRARVERLVNVYLRRAKPDCSDPEVQRFDWTHSKRQGRYWVGAAKLHGRYVSRLKPVGAVLVLAEITPESVRLLDLHDQSDYNATPEQLAFFERADRVMQGYPTASRDDEVDRVK